MSTPTMEQGVAPRAGIKIASCLAEASESLAELTARTESIDRSNNSEILGFSRQHLRALRDLLARGSRVVDQRIMELGGGSSSGENRERLYEISRNGLIEPIKYLASYRACCRTLCFAMKAAMAAADSATVLLLRDLVLRLEKELWMIDAPERNRGSDDSRAVALFLSC